MTRNRNIWHTPFESLFFLFLASLFLKVGSDSLEGPILRIWYAGLWTLGFLYMGSQEKAWNFLRNLPFLLFLGFLAFELVRAGWGFLQMSKAGITSDQAAMFKRYLWSPVEAFFYAGFFIQSYSLFKNRVLAGRLLWVLAGCGFLLAITAIPPLLIKGHHEYVVEGKRAYFPAFVYFHPFVKKYLVGTISNINYIGDIIGIGFFAALAIFFYELQKLLHDAKNTDRNFNDWLHFLGLPALFVGAQALAIILFFSRGTTITFTLSFLIFIVLALVKFFSKKQIVVLGIILALVMGFLVWAANLQATWKEVGTAQKEVMEEQKNSSFETNRVGARRALDLYKKYPIWGTGSRGYEALSTSVEKPDEDAYYLADLVALCHYLQMLAENGAGAYLYFLFLLSYFLAVLWGLVKTDSRFQFITGLSLFCVVLMILVHAAVKPVMEYFAIAMPVYILMGASLAVLKQDFAHS